MVQPLIKVEQERKTSAEPCAADCSLTEVTHSGGLAREEHAGHHQEKARASGNVYLRSGDAKKAEVVNDSGADQLPQEHEEDRIADAETRSDRGNRGDVERNKQATIQPDRHRHPACLVEGPRERRDRERKSKSQRLSQALFSASSFPARLCSDSRLIAHT